jgi:uncharacterized membrane protein
VDVLGTYRTSPARFNNTLAAPQSNVLAISSDHAAYGFGDTVNLTVTVTNSGGSALSGQLQTQLYFVDYAGTYLLYTPAARSVSVLPGGSTSETFTVSRSQYQSPGQFLAVATLGSERAEARFQVNSGLSLDLAAPATANAGTPFAVTLNLTNTLTTALSNIDLMISFPSSASGVNPMTRLTIPSLAPGAGYSKSYTLAIPSADSAMITAYATSADGGNAEASAIIKMAGPASLEVQLELPPTVTPGETFNAVARVRNTGSQTAHNVSVNLSLSDGLTTSTPTSASQAQLAPGAEWKVTWPLKASAAGVYAVQVKAAIGTDTARSADGLITVARGDLAISLKSSEPYLKQPQKIVLTLTNESAVAAAINLIGVSSNPNIGFTIYDDSTGNPVQSPIIIPARSSVTLTLIIRAGDFEKGQISIRATAVENPQVAKTLVIRVNDLNTVYMPLIRR